MEVDKEWSDMFLEKNKKAFVWYLDIFGSRSVYLLIFSIIFEAFLTILLWKSCINEAIGSLIFLISIVGIVYCIRSLKIYKILMNMNYNEADLNEAEIKRVLSKSQIMIQCLQEWIKSTFVRTNPVNLSIVCMIILGTMMIFQNIPLYVMFDVCITAISCIFILSSIYFVHIMKKE
ncbi:hypothetical protein TVAG_459100 [Trichomonas vaginalis G3]|uniref:Uncharacterized protein n=1 Tax=Trichomonas vaginalis (strain ATCC PRA-98 / G3) TaxID=412133 RepID=A2E6B5_TRIV3|nr:hypothetical protein TVAGG3_0394750 [Trichomonas vaginalis G3]EAY11838.1 hypothetical protein TVAG_459100 [Trichomonas vaginalis G3]KAI5534256.1 hypothetical protein TVAGG3_0394750 [Trichomonas vaginalis G3]|eukprot:XP_001324061.1 hypothetical protein [Trichomonas vaginalis G3]